MLQEDAGDETSFSMYRRYSAHSKRSSSVWRFYYFFHHYFIKVGKPFHVFLPLSLCFVLFKLFQKTQSKVHEVCWAISSPPKWT